MIRHKCVDLRKLGNKISRNVSSSLILCHLFVCFFSKFKKNERAFFYFSLSLSLSPFTAGFINDIALTDDDVHDLMKMWHNNIEVQVDDPNVRHPRKLSEPVSKRRPRKKNKGSHRKRKRCRKK